MTRRAVAPHFYSGDCAAQVDGFLAGFTPPDELAQPIAGLVPHAGWLYSGAVAAKVIKCLQAASPESVVIFGAVHSWGVQDGAVYAAGAWATPGGELAVDEALAATLLEQCAGRLTDDADSHANEHSIEVQVPLIEQLLPGVPIVPIAMPPTAKAAATGSAVGAALLGAGKRVAVLGSTDLTHYGSSYGFTPWGVGAAAHRKMQENDRRIIDLALAFDADKVVEEAHRSSNACGAGAIAATVAAARAMGADKAALVEYITSHDMMGEPPEAFQMAVGYGGLIFGS
jgi:AmmeMemoRadiSam system protein B